MTTDLSQTTFPSTPNPYLFPSQEIYFYTENFKEFPIIVPNNLPFFPVAIYKIAIIKSVEQLILTSITKANEVAKDFLSRVQYANHEFKEYDEAIQYGLIKPTSAAMQPVMNVFCFQQQLCWILSEFSIKSGLNIPAEQLAAIANIIVDENVTTVLEQVSTKACKSVFVMIQDLVKETLIKHNQNQSLQSAKVMYGSYLSPASPSILAPSFLLPENVPPSYPTVKNIPPEYAAHARSHQIAPPPPSSFNEFSQGFPAEYILPTDLEYLNQY